MPMVILSRCRCYLFFSFLYYFCVVAQSYSASPLWSSSPSFSQTASFYLSPSPSASVSVLLAVAGPEIILIPGGQTALSADFPYMLAGVFLFGIVFTIVIYYIFFKESLSLHFNLSSIFAAHTADKKKEMVRKNRERKEERTLRNRDRASDAKSPAINSSSNYDKQPPQVSSSPLRNDDDNDDKVIIMAREVLQKKIDDSQSQQQQLSALAAVREEVPFRVAVINHDDAIDKLLLPPSRARSAKVAPIPVVVDPVTTVATVTTISTTKTSKNTDTHLVIVADPISPPILWSPTISSRSMDPEITDHYSNAAYTSSRRGGGGGGGGYADNTYRGSSSSMRGHVISSLTPRINRLANVSLQSISTIDGMHVSVIKT